jgi:hypothetical protein
MKNFSQFNEEISIRGNKGIPPEKLRDIEARGAEKVRGLRPHDVGGQMMNLMRQSEGFIRGNQRKLEELAVKVIRDTYGVILKNVDIQADIVDNGRTIDEFMKQEDAEKKKETQEAEKEKNERVQELEQQLEEAQDEDDKEEIEDILNKLQAQETPLSPEAVEMAVAVRKIMNNIIQGEAKNTKHMLHTDAVKDGLKEIYGNRWEQAFNTWDQLTKAADKMDWIIPAEFRARQMQQAPEGMAGCVSCRFPKKKDDSKTKKEKEADAKAQEELLKSLSSQEDASKKSEEINRLLKGVSKPTIKVKAIDFPMLLHELVKGVWEMICDLALPKEKRLRSEVFRQTSSFADEAEDWKYGPPLAQHLNDFIMANRKSTTYPNVKEYVFGALINRKRFSDEQILANLKNIFSGNAQGRAFVDGLIDEVVASLKGYYDKLDAFKKQKEEEERRSKERPEETMSKEEESEIDKLVKQSLQRDVPAEDDYSKMSQREIQALIDDALDAGEYGRVEMLTQYLKEGRQIYLRELQRINENHNLHTRRK